MAGAIRKQRRLGEILVELKYLERRELEYFFRTRMQPGLFLGDQLVRANLITPEDLARALARQFGLPYVNLRVTPPDPETLPAIRVETAERFLTIPYRRDEKALQVATALPQRRGLTDMLSSESGHEVNLAVASRPGIEQAIRHWYHVERGATRQPPTADVAVTVTYLDLYDRLTHREEVRATVLNLSEAGACLQVRSDPATWCTDEPLRLEIQIPEVASPIICRALKRWANPAPPPTYGWRVGLEFTNLKAEARLVLNRHLSGPESAR